MDVTRGGGKARQLSKQVVELRERTGDSEPEGQSRGGGTQGVTLITVMPGVCTVKEAGDEGEEGEEGEDDEEDDDDDEEEEESEAAQQQGLTQEVQGAKGVEELIVKASGVSREGRRMLNVGAEFVMGGVGRVEGVGVKLIGASVWRQGSEEGEEEGDSLGSEEDFCSFSSNTPANKFST